MYHVLNVTHLHIMTFVHMTCKFCCVDLNFDVIVKLKVTRLWNFFYKNRQDSSPSSIISLLMGIMVVEAFETIDLVLLFYFYIIIFAQYQTGSTLFWASWAHITRKNDLLWLCALSMCTLGFLKTLFLSLWLKTKNKKTWTSFSHVCRLSDDVKQTPNQEVAL